MGVRKTKYFCIRVTHPSKGIQYVQRIINGDYPNFDIKLTPYMEHAQYTENPASLTRYAQAIALDLRMACSIVPYGREHYKKNPAPAIAERSARIHRYRKPLVAALKKAIREGDIKKEWEVRQKIRKLDYFMYAPRKGGIRLGK